MRLVIKLASYIFLMFWFSISLFVDRDSAQNSKDTEMKTKN